MEKQIFILTGEVHSGKTKAINEWLSNKINAAGIICPVINGKRILIFHPHKEQIILEAGESTENEILICGKYKFYKNAFINANNYISSLDFVKLEWVIIDEAGYLELNNDGLHDSMEFVLKKFYEYNLNFNIIIVVRDFLIEKIIEKYKLKNFVKIRKEDLEKTK